MKGLALLDRLIKEDGLVRKTLHRRGVFLVSCSFEPLTLTLTKSFTPPF